ncbi:MAG: hypothetical protein KAJ73_05550 [Zetaproteobacteria bacterium]|nr:hypothetical protein [Zetaproteobacteria bacterium]
MAYAAGSGNQRSHKNITSHIMLEHDEDEKVVAVVATQSMFGIGLWGAVDNVVRLTGADLRINHSPTPGDTQPVEVRRVSHQDKQAKRARSQAVMLEAKRR